MGSAPSQHPPSPSWPIVNDSSVHARTSRVVNDTGEIDPSTEGLASRRAPSIMKALLLLIAVVTACSDPAEPLPVSNGQGPAPYDPGIPYAPTVGPADVSPNVTN